MKRCVTQLQLSFTLETLAETAVVAEKIDHKGLQQACVDFALQEENRWALYHASHNASWYIDIMHCTK